MSVVAPQVESYLYDGLAGFRSVQITDAGGGPFTFTLDDTYTLSDALSYWATAATAHGTLSGSYTFQWLPALGVVSLGCSISFTIVMDGSLSTALGFSSSTKSGSSSYTSDQTPMVACNPLGIDYEVPDTIEETELRRYRYGRITSRIHYRGQLVKAKVHVATSLASDLLAGPMFASRAVYYPHGYGSGAWSKTNLRGYLDLYPYTKNKSDPWGADDMYTTIHVVGVLEGS